MDCQFKLWYATILTETIGINTRVDLGDAEAAMRKCINREHMLNGVTIMNPDVTYIEADVEDWKRYDHPAEHIYSRKDNDRRTK